MFFCQIQSKGSFANCAHNSEQKTKTKQKVMSNLWLFAAYTYPP
jgi:hypothetical protein